MKESLVDEEAKMELKTEAERQFAAVYNADPEGVWSAPGRVNLIGEHTDYNKGLVLPVALPQSTFVAAARRSDRVSRLHSEAMGAPVEIKLDDIGQAPMHGWERYPAGVLWALEQAGYQINGLDMSFVSDVPIGSGLSSSAAMEAATAAAVSDLYGFALLTDDAGRTTLAGLCQRAENDIAMAPTGGMDQAIALRGEAGHALYLDCLDWSSAQVPCDFASHELSLLVINTRVMHELSDGQYGKRRRDCEKACVKLGVESLREIDPQDLDVALAKLGRRLQRRVRHVVTEIQRVRQAKSALEACDFVELGKLFVDSHASLRDDYEVSCPELDTAVVTALEAGCLGARMTGGGFGGSAIALVYDQALDSTVQAISTAFTRKDWRVPQFLTVQPAGSAHRVV